MALLVVAVYFGSRGGGASKHSSSSYSLALYVTPVYSKAHRTYGTYVRVPIRPYWCGGVILYLWEMIICIVSYHMNVRSEIHLRTKQSNTTR